MLGEIRLDQWRCLAEFVDNSADSFIEALRSGNPVSSPKVSISVPTVDDASAKVVVRDNGPGMSPETLERAVRAGWTSNDPMSSLGMFGMGFNIATARLGTITRVWTTRRDDTEWYGLEIDFDTLVREKHFRTPKLARPKVDPHEQGTEVSVERLKPEQREWFARTRNRSKISKELGRTYSTMLRSNGRPISFQLSLNGTLVEKRDHCIWGGEGNPERIVRTAKYGEVDAYQVVDGRLADRPFCVRCWQWLSVGEQDCPACGLNDEIVLRERRVYGWLGVQRYLHQNDFGIDFLRNGRKIEVANKDLFFWNDEDTIQTEYPTDDPRNRGRIVGEIHIDHCRVTYAKDRFDRNDSAWQEMVRIVRGDGPLRPEKARQLGFGENDSPLFLLYQVFRRSSPKPKVAGSYARLLIFPDNDRATEMAKRYYAGEPEYQTDFKWWELVQEADRELLTPTSGDGAGDSSGLEGFGAQTEGPDDQSEGEPTEEPESTTATIPPERIPLPSLSRAYREDDTRLRWEIHAYQVERSDPDLGDGNRPWVLKASPTGIHDFFVNTEHSVFRSATMTPLDRLLAELAWSAIDFQRQSPSSATFSSVLTNLREQYAATSKLDPQALSGEATLTLRTVARSLSRNVDSYDSRALFEDLPPTEQDGVLQRMATRSVPNPQQTINEGQFLEFAPGRTFLRFFETHPELFFDRCYWDVAYATLDYGRPTATEEARSQIVRYYANLLSDAVWLAERDSSDLEAASRERLLRAYLSLELLNADTVTEDD